jgi:hypothetical protein
VFQGRNTDGFLLLFLAGFASDVFALGCLGYFLDAGVAAFVFVEFVFLVAHCAGVTGLEEDGLLIGLKVKVE